MLITLVSCTGGDDESPTIQGGQTAEVTNKWQDTAFPLSIELSTDFDSFYDSDDTVDGKDPIERMMALWNDSHPQLTFFNDPSKVANYEPSTSGTYKDGLIGIYLSHSWYNDFSSSALAVTQYWATSSGLIIHGDIIFNNRDYTFSTDTATDGGYDLATVALHELGHLIGLKHTAWWEYPSIMGDSLGAQEVKQEVYDVDKENLTELYPSTTALALSKSIQKLRVEKRQDGSDEKVYRGVIELHPDGTCYHYLENKLIEKHEVNL